MTPKESSPHAIAARIEKREAAGAVGVDDAFISAMVDRFYGTIQEDAMLGPIFASRISDWDGHLAHMKRFWRSVLFNSGEFSGSPMAKHIAISGLGAEQFHHWLELFYANLHAMGASEGAMQLVGGRARMIAESLLSGILVQSGAPLSFKAATSLPHPS